MKIWRGRRCPAVILIGALSLGGCAKVETVAAKKKEPFTLEKIEGTERKRVRLDAKAAQRLGVETATVTDASTVPYGALLYDTKGGVSVYTVPEPLLYVRAPVKVRSIDGDVVALAEGPPAGTAVVTAGGSEITGIEFGVGK